MAPAWSAALVPAPPILSAKESTRKAFRDDSTVQIVLVKEGERAGNRFWRWGRDHDDGQREEPGRDRRDHFGSQTRMRDNDRQHVDEGIYNKGLEGRRARKAHRLCFASGHGEGVMLAEDSPESSRDGAMSDRGGRARGGRKEGRGFEDIACEDCAAFGPGNSVLSRASWRRSRRVTRTTTHPHLGSGLVWCVLCRILLQRSVDENNMRCTVSVVKALKLAAA